MTEILVQSLEEEGGVVRPSQLDIQFSSSIQMQGFAAADGPSTTSDHALAESRDRRDRASSRNSVPASLKSEPDVDTIMPLPPSSFYPRGQGGGGYLRARGEGSDSEDDREGGPYSPTMASFTAVEVRECESECQLCLCFYLH